MGKKIVFTGPASAGKTSLRKIFFEYQNADDLLKYAIEPTFGVESILVNLGKSVGIFDLAGQENDRWLEGEERDVFCDASVIIIVVDVSAPIGDSIGFVNRVLHVKAEIRSLAMTFLLVHKIDLVSEKDLSSFKRTLNATFTDMPKFRIEYTSIMPAFFLNTMAVFKDIAEMMAGEGLFLDQVDFRMVTNSITVIRALRSGQAWDRATLAKACEFGLGELDGALANLSSKNFIRIAGDGDSDAIELAIALTPGQIEVLEREANDRLVTLEKKLLNQEIPDNVDVPSFIGFLLADANGIVLFMAEVFDGAFSKFLGIKARNELELMPSFISALSLFSKEIGIVGLSDFRLKGKGVSLYLYQMENLQATFFINKDVETDKIKSSIHQYMTGLIAENKIELSTVAATGNVGSISHLENTARDWLVQLNAEYQQLATSERVFDPDQVKVVFNKLENFTQTYRKIPAKTLADIKDLKTNLVSAIMEKNLESLDRIYHDTDEMEKSLSTSKR
jgi:GTPase SAR1 family protein